jgi:hypothetical protein
MLRAMASGRGWSHPLCSALLAAAFLLLYVSLGRQALHGFDAFLALKAVRTGQGQAHGHFLYFPLCRAFWAALQPLGLSLHGTLRVLSATGVGAGVLFAHRSGIALRLGPAGALLLAMSFGCLPAACYSASVVEVDGLILGAAGLTWWLAIRLARHWTVSRAVAIGLSSGVCAGLHGGGHLLIASACWLLSCWSMQRFLRRRQWRPFGRAMALVALAGLVHGAIWLLLAWAVGYSGQGTMVENTLQLEPHWARWPSTLLREWLIAYAPFCVLWTGSLVRGRLRGVALGFALCLAGYLTLTNVVMSHFEPLGPGFLERGAFMVGIAFPTAALGMLWLRPLGRAAAVAVAAAVALIDVRTFDWQPMLPGFDRALQQLVAAEPMEVWTGDYQTEYGWVLKYVASVRTFRAGEVPYRIQVLERDGVPVDDERLGLWFDLRYEQLQREHFGLAMTAAALDELRASGDARVRNLVAVHLPAKYRLEPIVQEPVHAFRVLRR